MSRRDHIEGDEMYLGQISWNQMCVAPMYESCYTYEWVMSHIQMTHVTHISRHDHFDERRNAFVADAGIRWASYLSMRHVTNING